MEPIIIDSDNTYTDSSNNYKSIASYNSADDYEPMYKESEREILVVDLSELILYLPFDDYEVITTQTVVNHNSANSNYEDNSSLANLITENLRVGEVRYSALPIEYSPTSEQGIAIVFNIKS
ncbi:15465_t:CDS:2 [Cetraspora pellucida]|uniref:15465_t:CDS:1 n=1 Tax=Cetraspora pellucida TaxID=1433469 RepID=A0ACA9PKT4_9GLOM|nr:15465_t:CDS:2 [Cetraspora pellucida]